MAEGTGAGAAGGGAAPTNGAGTAGGAAPPAPAAGAAPSAPAREPVLFRPEGADRDFDIAPALEKHLREYKRKIVIDGAESEVDLESAFKAASLEPAARRRFTEADKIRRQAEAQIAQIRVADQAMNDPVRAEAVLSKRWGQPKFEEWVLGHAERILREEKLPPRERAALEALRRDAQALEQRAAEMARRDAELKRRENEAKQASQRATRERIEREWPPLLTNLGVPQGFVKDAMRGMLAELNAAQKHSIRLSENEAAARVAADLRRKMGAINAAPPPAEVIAKQPGRESPPAASAPRDEAGRFANKNRPLRPDDIRGRIERIGR